MSRYQEACRPYDNAVPVTITRILDRLSAEQFRQIALILSVVDPAQFERVIREAQQPHDQAKGDHGVAGR